MTHSAVTCHIDDTVDRPAQLMWENDCGAIPVVRDDGTLAGMITDRDICMAAYTQGRPLSAIPVTGVMAHHVIAAQMHYMVGEIAELMAQHQIRRMPIVDDHGRPIGMISLSDVATESVEPDTRLKTGVSMVTHTLAAICRPRMLSRHAAA
jgi:CBS domain-containing protein